MFSLKSLREECEKGNYYEAQHKYNHFLNKFLNSGKIEKGVGLCLHGIKSMMKYSQKDLALELSQILMDYFQKHDKFDHIYPKFDMPGIDLLIAVGELYEIDDSQRFEMFQDSLRLWTNRFPKGHPRLQREVAKCLVLQGKFPEAHHLYSNFSGYEDEHAELVLEWAKRGKPEELELFISRSVLHKLGNCGNDIASSHRLFAKMLKLGFTEANSPEKKHLVPPLVNFVRLVFISLFRKNYSLMKIICIKYDTHLDRDLRIRKNLLMVMKNNFKEMANAVDDETQRRQNSTGDLMGMLSGLLSGLTGGNNPSGGGEVKKDE